MLVYLSSSVFWFVQRLANFACLPNKFSVAPPPRAHLALWLWVAPMSLRSPPLPQETKGITFSEFTTIQYKNANGPKQTLPKNAVKIVVFKVLPRALGSVGLVVSSFFSTASCCCTKSAYFPLFFKSSACVPCSMIFPASKKSLCFHLWQKVFNAKPFVFFAATLSMNLPALNRASITKIKSAFISGS